MSVDHVVIDTDAHYKESIEDLASYLDEDDPWRMRLAAEPGKITPSNTPDHYLYGRIQRDEVGYHKKHMSPEDIPTAMERVGADKIIMLSQTAISFSRIGADDRRPISLARGYVEYMLDKIVDPNIGVYTAIPIPHQDPSEAVELIDDYGDERGIVGICMITKGPEPPLGNRRYDAVYGAAEEADLPVIFHAGGSSLDDFYVKGYTRFIESHSLGFLWSNMAQVTSVVLQGVPEKFPGLDFVFQEAGIMWVPSYMGRLDAEYLKRRSEVPLLNKLPSEYLSEFYYGIQPLERPNSMAYFEEAIKSMGGADQLMYASDFPHWDYDPPSAVTDIPFLSDEEKGKILGGNAAKVFGI